MKPIFKFSVLVLSILLAFIAAKPVKKNKLIGTWRLADMETNGKPEAKVMNRTWTFERNSQFEGKIFLSEGSRTYNKGIYLLADDTTMVTIHRDKKGNMIKLANYYYFHIQNDSLHFYGNFLYPDPRNSKAMLMFYIDEWWLKLPSLP